MITTVTTVLLLMLICMVVECGGEMNYIRPLEVHRRIHNLTREEVSKITRDFTRYHLYFRTYKLADSQVCLTSDERNATYLQLDNKVAMSPNEDYRPRELKRSQISWKNTAKSRKANNTSDFKPSDSSNGKDSEKNTKVHDYLIFCLYLPDHPTSKTANHMIASVAPMFPSVVIVYGNAYEFREMVYKYFVHSFPRILLFKRGLYVTDYEGKYDVSHFAAYIASWIQELPQTYPLVLPPPKPLPSVFYLDLLGSYKAWLPLYQPNLEPFLGSVENYKGWDFGIFFFSCLYCLGRLVYFVSRPGRQENE